MVLSIRTPIILTIIAALVLSTFTLVSAAPQTPAKKALLRKTLTNVQYLVTQESATENPFENAYWDNHADGIYVDIVDGTPLFSSKDKYDSGTGWPTFSKPIKAFSLRKVKDTSIAEERVEIRSRKANSHLWHLFMDGPKEYGYVRYCMNSAAFRFIPVAELEKEGYGAYVTLFTK